MATSHARLPLALAHICGYDKKGYVLSVMKWNKILLDKIYLTNLPSRTTKQEWEWI